MSMTEYTSQTRVCAREVLENLITTQLEGYPVKVSGYGLEVSKDATEEERGSIGRKLVALEHEASALYRFYIGDWYNDLDGEEYGAKRRFLMENIPNFNDDVDKMFRNYGWVAKKWPVHLRSGKHAWSHYRNNKPGEPLKKAKNKDRIAEAFRAAWTMRQFGSRLSCDEAYKNWKHNQQNERVEEKTEGVKG